MTLARFVGTLCLIATLLVFPQARAVSQQSSTTPIDISFQEFWAARSTTEAERVASKVVETGVRFDDALRRLKAGRPYTPQKAGVSQRSYQKDGVEYHYAVNVPSSYDASRRYQVRFQLHGGVGGRIDSEPRGTGEIGALAGAEQIYVIPYAWRDAPWWSEDQVFNLDAILDTLKRVYNVDENRVVVAGVSDGGTGAYYIAMRETTRFASFLPLNGFIMVLGNESIDDGKIYPNNLRNKPMFVVNGGRDRLYPTLRVEPFVRHLMNGGVEVAYHPQPEGEHNTAWWPEVKGLFEKFVTDHPRDPHPDNLTWETSDQTNNRAHWLVIDDVAPQAGDATQMSDMNLFRELLGTSRLFIRATPAGRVDLVRNGNAVQATTKGVAAFTLLLSPDEFDFNQPVQVVVNGRTMFSGRVQPSVESLMKWAARDNDRTMLYAAELPINLAH